MNEKMLPVFFWLMITATGAWFFLSARLIRRLQTMHPKTYQSLGNPNIIRRRKAGQGLLHFIARRQFRDIADAEIQRLGDGLFALLCLFLINLGGCLLLLFF